MPRFFCPTALASGQVLDLPDGAARHVQVLRLQPGDALTLFNGAGGEYEAAVQRMGRSSVTVEIGAHQAIEREAAVAVHLAMAVPANDRMDWLVEKATELGVASIQPLMASRSVLRLSGERASKKQAHWQAIAVAACEQSGRNRVPAVHAVRAFAEWKPQGDAVRMVLSLAPGAGGIAQAQVTAQGLLPQGGVIVLSGPEGGLAPDEEAQAAAQGFAPISLGARTLRAETAPLAALAALTLGRP
jgi:16S rRNA (uracil1498-N3)-methyltransferase